MLALCQHGWVPAWCRARLKIAVKQQLEHIGPCNLSFISLNQGRLGGRGQLQGKKGMEHILLVGISHLFQFLALFSYHSLLLITSPNPTTRCPRKEETEKGQWGQEYKRKERRKKLELWGRLGHLLPSSLTRSDHHHKAAIGHFNPQLYHGSRESRRQKGHRWRLEEGRKGELDDGKSTKSCVLRKLEEC